MTKFVLMSFFTAGLYDVYWFYWNWRRQRELADPGIHAGLRTFLSPVTAYLLFRDVRGFLRGQQPPASPVRWSPAVLAVAYFVLVMSFAAPGWWWMLTLLSFIPLVPVQYSINRDHETREEPIDERVTAANMGVMFAGIVVFALLFWLGRALDRGMLDMMQYSR